MAGTKRRRTALAVSSTVSTIDVSAIASVLSASSLTQWMVRVQQYERARQANARIMTEQAAKARSQD